MSAKEFESLADAMTSSMKRLETLRKAEAAISIDGGISTDARVWISGVEIKLTEKNPDLPSGYRTVRGREMAALGIKKVIQGQIDAELAKIATLRQRMSEVTA